MSWFRYGFGPEFLDYHPTLPFYLDYSQAKFSTTSTYDTIRQAINKIIENYPAPYTLICSGGVDSQSMILAWKLSGHPFEVVSARYNDGINDYDLEQLDQLSKRENIKVNYIDIDIIEFHEKQLIDWAIKYDCASPHILSHMYICSHIKTGTVISSGVQIIRNRSAMSYHTSALIRYAKNSGQSVIPHFWSHDQYMTTIFQSVNDAAISKQKDKTNSYEYKYMLYKEVGLDVIPQTSSLNGFEKIKEKYDATPVNYRLRSMYGNQPSKRPYDLLFRYSLNKYIRPTSGTARSIYF